MEDRVSNDEAYCSILKTVYLFLENNNLVETSESFLREISVNYGGVNFNDINPRTLILRPCDLNDPGAVAINTDRQVIICIADTHDQTDPLCKPGQDKCECRNTAQIEVVQYNAPRGNIKTTSATEQKENAVLQSETSPKKISSKKIVSRTASPANASRTISEALSKKDTTSRKGSSNRAFPEDAISHISGTSPRKDSNNKKGLSNRALTESAITHISREASKTISKEGVTSRAEDTISRVSGITKDTASKKAFSSKTFPVGSISRASEASKRDSIFAGKSSITENVLPSNSIITSVKPESDSDSEDKTKSKEYIPLEKKNVSSNIPDVPTKISSKPVEADRISQVLREMTRENFPERDSKLDSYINHEFPPKPVSSSDISEVLQQMTQENLKHIEVMELAEKQSQDNSSTSNSVDAPGHGVNAEEVSRILKNMTLENNVDYQNITDDSPPTHAKDIVVRSASGYLTEDEMLLPEKSRATVISPAPTLSKIKSTLGSTSKDSKLAKLEPSAYSAKTLTSNQDESGSRQVDFTLIKKHLLDANEDTKLKLLQALRWRLTKTNSNIRDHNLANFIRHDILYLNTPWIRSNGQTFFETYFYPLNQKTPHILQEAMARFINTIASLQLGRDYLGKNTDIIELIILRVLMGKTDVNISISDRTREFLIATIQKLSLSSKLRTVMIRAGIVEWLINVLLTSHSTMSNYEAEYAVALLTNLCINTEITLRCEHLTESIGPLLVVLLNTPHKCCIPYLVGIFYTFLRNGKINKDLEDMGVIATLQELLMQGQDEEVYKQLNYILNMEPQQETGLNDYCVIDGVYSFPDYIEDELDENDRHLEPNGETFLDEYRTPYQYKGEKHIHIIQNYNILKNKALHTVLEENPEESVKDPNTISKIRFKSQGTSSTSCTIQDKKPTETSKTMTSNLKRTERKSRSPTTSSDKCSKKASLAKDKKSPGQSPERDRFYISDAEKTYILQNEKKALLVEQKMEAGKRKVLEECLGIGGRYQYVSEKDKDHRSSCDEMLEVEPRAHKSCRFFPPDQYNPIQSQLNYYYCTSEINPNPFKGSKYSCPCYDSILAFLKDEAIIEDIPPNRGRKSSNVVYGPFKNQVTCNCPFYVNSQEKCKIFNSCPKVQRTP